MESLRRFSGSKHCRNNCFRWWLQSQLSMARECSVQGAGPEVKHSLKTCCVLATYSDAIINLTIAHYSHKGGFEEPGRTWKTSFYLHFLHGQPEFLPGSFSSLLPRWKQNNWLPHFTGGGRTQLLQYSQARGSTGREDNMGRSREESTWVKWKLN